MESGEMARAKVGLPCHKARKTQVKRKGRWLCMEGAIAGKATRMAAACAVAAAAIVGCIALAPAEESAEALVPDAGIEQAEGKTFLIGDSRFTSVIDRKSVV